MKNLYSLTILLLLLPATLAFSQRISIEEYIKNNKNMAIDYMEECGIPASVILGIAIHESAAGNSKIARHLNNHFGIKGPNNSKIIRSSYKGYDSVRDSYADFVGLLQRRSRYNRLFQNGDSDYETWIRGIARAGYAMSKTWPRQVLKIIKEHQLYRWDQSPEVADKSYTVYKVQSGDTLSGIARRFQTSVRALVRKNGLRTTRLQIGQNLKL